MNDEDPDVRRAVAGHGRPEHVLALVDDPDPDVWATARVWVKEHAEQVQKEATR